MIKRKHGKRAIDQHKRSDQAIVAAAPGTLKAARAGVSPERMGMFQLFTNPTISHAPGSGASTGSYDCVEFPDSLEQCCAAAVLPAPLVAETGAKFGARRCKRPGRYLRLLRLPAGHGLA